MPVAPTEQVAVELFPQCVSLVRMVLVRRSIRVDGNPGDCRPVGKDKVRLLVSPHGHQLGALTRSRAQTHGAGPGKVAVVADGHMRRAPLRARANHLVARICVSPTRGLEERLQIPAAGATQRLHEVAQGGTIAMETLGEGPQCPKQRLASHLDPERV